MSELVREEAGCVQIIATGRWLTNGEINRAASVELSGVATRAQVFNAIARGETDQVSAWEREASRWGAEKAKAAIAANPRIVVPREYPVERTPWGDIPLDEHGEY